MCDLCFTYVVLDDGLKVGTFMINLRRFDFCFFAVLKRRAQAHHNGIKINLKANSTFKTPPIFCKQSIIQGNIKVSKKNLVKKLH